MFLRMLIIALLTSSAAAANDCNWANRDNDKVIGQSDFGFFQTCRSGPETDYDPGCEWADVDDDGDVDLSDFGGFQRCFGAKIMATYYVKQDGTDGAGIAGGIGTPWATPTYAATRASDDDTILLYGGVWSSNPSYAFTTQATQSKDLTFDAWPATGDPIFDDSAGWDNEIWYVNLTGKTYTIKNIIFRATGSIATNKPLFNYASTNMTFIFENCNFEITGPATPGNVFMFWNGVDAASLNVTFDTCTFSDTSANGSNGAAIYSAGANEFTFTDCTFATNGITFQNYGSLITGITMTRCDSSGIINSLIRAVSSADIGDITLTNCNIVSTTDIINLSITQTVSANSVTISGGSYEIIATAADKYFFRLDTVTGATSIDDISIDGSGEAATHRLVGPCVGSMGDISLTNIAGSDKIYLCDLAATSEASTAIGDITITGLSGTFRGLTALEQLPNGSGDSRVTIANNDCQWDTTFTSIIQLGYDDPADIPADPADYDIITEAIIENNTFSAIDNTGELKHCLLLGYLTDQAIVRYNNIRDSNWHIIMKGTNGYVHHNKVYGWRCYLAMSTDTSCNHKCEFNSFYCFPITEVSSFKHAIDIRGSGTFKNNIVQFAGSTVNQEELLSIEQEDLTGVDLDCDYNCYYVNDTSTIDLWYAGAGVGESGTTLSSLQTYWNGGIIPGNDANSVYGAALSDPANDDFTLTSAGINLVCNAGITIIGATTYTCPPAPAPSPASPASPDTTCQRAGKTDQLWAGENRPF